MFWSTDVEAHAIGPDLLPCVVFVLAIAGQLSLAFLLRFAFASYAFSSILPPSRLAGSDHDFVPRYCFCRFPSPSRSHPLDDTGYVRRCREPSVKVDPEKVCRSLSVLLLPSSRSRVFSAFRLVVVSASGPTQLSQPQTAFYSRTLRSCCRSFFVV